MLIETTLSIDENIFPVYKVAVLINELKKQGINLDLALNGTDLTYEMLGHSSSRISFKQLIRVYENIVNLTKDPAIGLIVGKEINITDYGMYGYALISSDNLREALEFSIKYHQLAIPTVSMELKEEGENAVFEMSNTLFDSPELIQFNLEFQFSLTLSLFRDMLGDDFELEEVHFEHNKPKHHSSYNDVLNCDVFFNQTKNKFKFKKEFLEKKLVYANPLTRDLSIKYCDKELEKGVFSYGLAHQVYIQLLESKYKFPDIEDVSKDLHMTSRTLRRKLKLQGTTFQALLNYVRHKRAKEYLISTTVSIDEIASVLGYSKSSNFRNAFKKWTGLTPSSFRKFM